MLHIHTHTPTRPIDLEWTLPRSKSLWARLLLLDALEGQAPPAPSGSDTPIDIRALAQALQAFAQGETTIDVQESGTAMRLMLAFLAAKTNRSLRLQGQGRQHLRPIAPLVDGLRQLGAKIDYLGDEGFPPLAIHPTRLHAELLTLDASASSQYLSALFLLAPLLSEGLGIDTRAYGISSRPYADMTLALLRQRGYLWQETEPGLFLYRGHSVTSPLAQAVEADWSAASYAYSLLALLPEGSGCSLPDLHLPSLQGDAEALVNLFATLGIQTESGKDGVRLTHRGGDCPQLFTASMRACPDLVPAVVCALIGRKIPFQLTGVAHLRIKESDRLLALQTELAKLGYPLDIAPDSLSWRGTRQRPAVLPPLSSHGDHRIAMALSLLALSEGALLIDAPEVVSKSFPSYWQELADTGLYLLD